jgi:hypothetical protein
MASDQEFAQQIYREFQRAPMSAKTRAGFEQLVQMGNCDAIKRQLDAFIRRRPDVGRSIQRAGLPSFESAYPVVLSIWRQWRKERGLPSSDEADTF